MHDPSLMAEADWLEGALEQARMLVGIPDLFLEGFDAAARWVRFHAEHPETRAETFLVRETPDAP